MSIDVTPVGKPLSQEHANSFGYWVRRRRKALDLTQEELARSVSCSRFAIRKIEADERRPSKRLAERLAEKLAITTQERSVFIGAARTRGAPAKQPEGAPEQAEAAPFVGRSEEYGRLVGLIDALATGAGHLVLIEGEPGIGKSRLMREVARYAKRRGLIILDTRCYEFERAMAYQPVVDLATQALELASDSVLRKLPPVSLAEIAALVPAAAGRFAHLPPLSADFPEARQARLFRALLQLFDALACGRPLLVTVDDLQWADNASAQFVHYCARQAARRPMLALCAYREEELEADEWLAGGIESLRREAHAVSLPLARLQMQDAAALLGSLADPRLNVPGLAERLHRETDGNPFFLTSMLHSLAAGETSPDQAGQLPLPEALRASVRARLAHVPDQTRSTLDVAAVLGRRFDFETLASVSGEPEHRLVADLETLVRRRLLREESDEGVYDFSHDKVREVVYRDIGAARRLRLHRAVAQTLEQHGEGAPHERDARLAEHYERAHVWAKALQYLVLAANRSQKLFAMRDALQWLDRAVQLAETHPDAAEDLARAALYERRGAARAQAGQIDGAVADIRRVIDAARSRGDEAKAREGLIQLGMAYRRADAYADATACLTEPLAQFRALGDEPRAADTLYHLGTVAWSNGRNAEAIAFHQEAVDICERLQLRDVVAVQAFHGRGEAYFANSEPAQAIACYTRSLELARSIGDKSYESENLMMIGYARTGYMGLADYPGAGASFEAALAIARAADLQWHLGPTLLGLDHVRACTGQYAEAWSGMRKTLAWLEGVKQPRYQLIAHDLITHLLIDLGLDARAVDFLERAIVIARNANVLFWRSRLEAGLAIARIHLGGLDVGPALEAALRNARQNSERYLVTRCLEGLAELALARREPGQCLAAADELLSLAQQCGLREIGAQAKRWRAEALLASGDALGAKDEFSHAAQSAQDIGRIKLALDCSVGLARACMAAGDVEAARVWSDKSRGLASRIVADLQHCELETPAALSRAARHGAV